MKDLESLYNEILEAKESDSELSILCYEVAEYAPLHLYQRKINGCNSLGEIEHLLDEFRRMIVGIIRYCGERNYIDNLAIYTVDITDKDLEKLGADWENSFKKQAWEARQGT